jgi:predicted nucleotide-binding protein
MPSRANDYTINKELLEKFLRQVPSLSQVVESRSKIISLFAYYLTEELGEPDVTPMKIRACYEAASIPAPVNMTDAMQKSRAFVSTREGMKLHRDVRAQIQKSLAQPESEANTTEPGIEHSADKQKNVVVVHGRDLGLRDAMFQFLRSAGLRPIEWNDAVRRTQRASPYTGEVVDALFRDAQAVVVLLSPDEHVELKASLRSGDSADNSGWQPRPNVFVEAGMALARDEARTVLVQIGTIRHASDLAGRNSISFDGSSASRHDLIERLRVCGCAISISGNSWLRDGIFSIATQELRKRGSKTK